MPKQSKHIEDGLPPTLQTELSRRELLRWAGYGSAGAALLALGAGRAQARIAGLQSLLPGVRALGAVPLGAQSDSPLDLQLPFWGDGALWDQPQYYESIQAGRRRLPRSVQTADIDGDGQDELLARGPGGMLAQRFDPDTGQWLTLPGTPSLFADAGGWGKPQYYQTIQTADLDGDGRAEILARDGAGIQAWKYESDPSRASYQQWSPLPRGPAWDDLGSWDQVQYYQTIQCADIDGDGRAELLARDGAGIQAWKFTAAGTWSVLPRGPAWEDDPGGWDRVQYYQTIQTGRVKGSASNPNNPPGPGAEPVAALLARDALCMQTWRFDGAAQSWSRTSAPLPKFTGDQLTAYNYLASFWDIDTGGVRDHYNDESGVIGQWRDDLKNNLVPAPSNVPAADWQLVHDQILKELSWVADVQTWYGTLTSGLITDIYLSQDLSVQSVGDYLNLPSDDDSTVAMNVLSLLFNGAWAVLGFPGLEAGTASAIAGILATAFSAAATSLPDGGSIQEAYADLQSTLASGFTAAKTANGQVQQSITGGLVDGDYSPGDYGLLSAIGQMIQSTLWSWPSTTDELVATAQRSYALSVWQSLVGAAGWLVAYASEQCPPGSYPRQYLYATGSDCDQQFWLNTSIIGREEYPATATLSALFDAPVTAKAFPLGVPLSDVFGGDNGWPQLRMLDFDGLRAAPPRPPLPSLGADLRVSATLAREAGTGEIIAVVILDNQGLGGATNVELVQAQLRDTRALGGHLPSRHTRLAAGRSHTLRLRFRGGIGAAGQTAVLRLGGRYQGGTFGASLRMTLP